MHDFTARLFTWRKGKEVIHDGKTMHFLGNRDNSYAFFRYNETDAVFVFLNNSHHDMLIPWASYSEIAPATVKGTDVVTGKEITLNGEVVVPAMTSLVVEYKR